jgi:hypothetical protein
MAWDLGGQFLDVTENGWVIDLEGVVIRYGAGARRPPGRMKMGDLTGLRSWIQIPCESRGRFSVGALRSPFVNLVRTRLLEPAIVVVRSRG